MPVGVRGGELERVRDLDRATESDDPIVEGHSCHCLRWRARWMKCFAFFEEGPVELIRLGSK